MNSSMLPSNSPTSVSPTGSQEAGTEERVLLAAIQVFAEKGFASATVNEIGKLAGTNGSAINYHFRGKDALYLAAVRRAYQDCVQRPDMPPPWTANTPPLTRLRLFIRHAVEQHLTPPNPASMTLMQREMLQPTTPACAEWVQKFIRPVADDLRQILRDLLPSTITEEALWRCGFSIVSQSLFYRQNRVIIQELTGPLAAKIFDPTTLAEHITRFTFVGLGLPLEEKE